MLYCILLNIIYLSNIIGVDVNSQPQSVLDPFS
jgi:hypothetical protein